MAGINNKGQTAVAYLLLFVGVLVLGYLAATTIFGMLNNFETQITNLSSPFSQHLIDIEKEHSSMTTEEINDFFYGNQCNDVIINGICGAKYDTGFSANCPSGTSYSSAAGACVCPTGYGWDTSTKSCTVFPPQVSKIYHVLDGHYSSTNFTIEPNYEHPAELWGKFYESVNAGNINFYKSNGEFVQTVTDGELIGAVNEGQTIKFTAPKLEPSTDYYLTLEGVNDPYYFTTNPPVSIIYKYPTTLKYTAVSSIVKFEGVFYGDFIDKDLGQSVGQDGITYDLFKTVPTVNLYKYKESSLSYITLEDNPITLYKDYWLYAGAYTDSDDPAYQGIYLIFPPLEKGYKYALVYGTYHNKVIIFDMED